MTCGGIINYTNYVGRCRKKNQDAATNEKKNR